MQKYRILWADDEIDLLKPHILFLEGKGYRVTSVNSGNDALDRCTKEHFDLVFLDENMPGMSGLETLGRIKTEKPSVPVVMITKSEEEYIMEEAIGSKITDYLIKPLNPNQLLISVKKILDNRRLITEKTTSGYQQDFGRLGMAYSDNPNYEEWGEIYRKLVYWELEFDDADDKSMYEVLKTQKNDANSSFTSFVMKNYESWLNNPDIDKPVLSHRLMQKKVFPLLKKDEPLFFVLIDNLRYDQWKILEPLISDFFNLQEEAIYYSILPTATAYARNAIFSGMMPADIAKMYPQLWVSDEEEEGKNNHEEELLKVQLSKNRLDVKSSYSKVVHIAQGKQVTEQINNMMNNDINVIVYNFVDMLSHARTDTTMIRELAPDETAYRSVTSSWFRHSPFFDAMREIAERGGRLIITTDHGTIRVKRPFKIIGDRNVNTNLRYKQGKSLGYDGKDIFSAPKPERLHLPKSNLSSEYVFAVEDYFFAYPNNFNYYVNYYKDTFQHGGISMEEILIPFAYLLPKNGS